MHEARIVEEQVQLTLIELCRACVDDAQQPGTLAQELVNELVREGVLSPTGAAMHEWRFDGRCLQRARVAVRLTRDLHVNAAGVALALDLLDEIKRLEDRLQAAGVDSR